MGTNFYFLSKDKNQVKKWFNSMEYELTDEPEWGYMIHLAKTSCGWLPLFQAHEKIKSVAEMREAYEKTGFQIIDEYGSVYTWEEFKKRVLEFNGGIRGGIPATPCNQDGLPDNLRDHNMPDHIPVSHFEYGNGEYAAEYFTDPDGYEFSYREFS